VICRRPISMIRAVEIANDRKIVSLLGHLSSSLARS
jgi:hypothetical protein